MAFDGFVISNIVFELNSQITGGRIYKIYQPENDELIITIKNNKDTLKLLLSANASLPLLYITKEQKENPMTAPNFCMLLRKHIGNGRITYVKQPDFERIVEIGIEHLNELGDICEKKLIIEIMGKHSNIIFCTQDNLIIDSIKHISFQVSSVREVLPGREYVFPPNHEKISPFLVTYQYFTDTIIPKPLNSAKALYTSINGFSPVIAEEICNRATISSAVPLSDLEHSKQELLFTKLVEFINDLKENNYLPNIVYRGKEPVEFSSTHLSIYEDLNEQAFNSISEVLETYYSEKNVISRIKQKSYDLRKVVSTILERTSKKYDLQLKQLDDTKNRDKYKVYGELINTYGYSLTPADKSLKALNYYSNEEITIPIDNTMSPSDNAKKYFAKYNKQKRTYEALMVLINETKSELDHLMSIQTSLDIALLENDLIQIKEELIQYDYIKNKAGNKKGKRTVKSKPFHYVSSDGFDIYVGKNNFQNDELTFKFANGGDWWFHAKGIPGSHVIVKTNGADELPDKTFEEAGKLAAYYSSGRENSKVEIDYTKRANLKKPPEAKPGFVIYHTNYSMLIEPSTYGIDEV